MDKTLPYRVDPKANRFVTSVQPAVWRQYDNPSITELDLILQVTDAREIANKLQGAIALGAVVFVKLSKEDFVNQVLPLVDKEVTMVNTNRQVYLA